MAGGVGAAPEPEAARLDGAVRPARCPAGQREPDAPPGAPPDKAQAGIAATRPGLGLAVVMLGVLITAVDTTIVVLALPEIERGLHVALTR